MYSFAKDSTSFTSPIHRTVPSSSRFAYKGLGKSVIYDQHDLCPELYALKFGESDDFIAKILRSFERFSYALADCVIVTNQSYKQLAMARGRLPEALITVVRNGPDVESARDREVVPHIAARPRTFRFFGHYRGSGWSRRLDSGPYKLTFSALQAPGRSEVYFASFMGAGRTPPECAKGLTRSLGLEDNVWFTGWISDRELYRRGTCDLHDICVSPETSSSNTVTSPLPI